MHKKKGTRILGCVPLALLPRAPLNPRETLRAKGPVLTQQDYEKRISEKPKSPDKVKWGFQETDIVIQGDSCRIGISHGQWSALTSRPPTAPSINNKEKLSSENHSDRKYRRKNNPRQHLRLKSANTSNFGVRRHRNDFFPVIDKQDNRTRARSKSSNGVNVGSFQEFEARTRSQSSNGFNVETMHKRFVKTPIPSFTSASLDSFNINETYVDNTDQDRHRNRSKSKSSKGPHARHVKTPTFGSTSLENFNMAENYIEHFNRSQSSLNVHPNQDMLHSRSSQNDVHQNTHPSGILRNATPTGYQRTTSKTDYQRLLFTDNVPRNTEQNGIHRTLLGQDLPPRSQSRTSQIILQRKTSPGGNNHQKTTDERRLSKRIHNLRNHHIKTAGSELKSATISDFTLMSEYTPRPATPANSLELDNEDFDENMQKLLNNGVDTKVTRRSLDNNGKNKKVHKDGFPDIIKVRMKDYCN